MDFIRTPGMPDTTGISHLAPSSAKDTFWITNDRARGDGVTLNTAAVQTAIDSAAAHDGVVVVPTGNFLCGPVTLYSHITLLMEDGATLLLRNDITITGSGTVERQGAVWWPAYKNNTLQYSRPQLFDFNNCSNIRVMNIPRRIHITPILLFGIATAFYLTTLPLQHLPLRQYRWHQYLRKSYCDHTL